MYRSATSVASYVYTSLGPVFAHWHLRILEAFASTFFLLLFFWISLSRLPFHGEDMIKISLSCEFTKPTNAIHMHFSKFFHIIFGVGEQDQARESIHTSNSFEYIYVVLFRSAFKCVACELVRDCDCVCVSFNVCTLETLRYGFYIYDFRYRHARTQ